MKTNFPTARFLALECLMENTLDFRPLMELDFFLSNLSALQAVEADYYFIIIKKRLYMARKVIGLVDENLLKPYEFLDFKVGEFELIEQDVNFLSAEGLIDLAALRSRSVQPPAGADSYLLLWNLVLDRAHSYKTKSSLYAFNSTLVIS
jgi:hypothetical protein